MFNVLNYKNILKLLGVDDFSTVPHVCKCPRCKKSGFSVHPVKILGVWGYCPHCKLTGDPIRLYELCYREKSPNDAIISICKELEDIVPVKQIYYKDTKSYCEFSQVYYGRIERLWTTASESASKSPIWLANRLSSLYIWPEDSYHKDKIRDLLGYAKREELMDILQIDIKGISGKYMTDLIILPYYSVPGLISGFGLVGKKDHISYTHMLVDLEAGFFGLNDAMGVSDSMLAVRNPLQVIRLALKGSIEGHKKIPAVALPPNKVLYDKPLRSSLVFWVGSSDDTRHLKNSLGDPSNTIIEVDSPPIWSIQEVAPDQWSQKPMSSIMKDVESAPKKNPAEVVARRILESGDKAPQLLEELGLNNLEKQSLILGYSGEGKKELEDLLICEPVGGVVQYSGKTIVEQTGGWYLRFKNKPDELLSDVVLRINVIQKIEEMDNNVFIMGDVIHQGRCISFYMNEDEFRKNTKDSLEAILASKGSTSPVYISSWALKNMYEIALQFHSPEVIIAQNYVGFDKSSHVFRFPNFTVYPDGIRMGDMFVASSEPMPGRNIDPRSMEAHPHMLDKWTAPCLETAVYWATVMGIGEALHSYATSGIPLGIALVGDKGSLAEYIFDIVKRDFGLLHYSLERGVYDAADKDSLKHHLPVAVNLLDSSKVYSKKWLERDFPNTLSLISPTQAAAMGHKQPWLFIRGETAFHRDSHYLIDTEVIPVVVIQKIVNSLVSGAPYIPEVSLRFFIDSHPTASKEVVDMAQSIVSRGNYRNSKSEAIKFILLLMEMLKTGSIEMRLVKNKDEMTKNGVLFYCEEGNTVILNIKAFIGKIRRENLNMYNWMKAMPELKYFGFEDSTGFMECPKVVWDNSVKTAKRLIALHRSREQRYDSRCLGNYYLGTE